MNPWVIDPIHIVLRLLLAMLLGGLIGFERERSNHAAGFRTHILVCIGSTLVMLLSMYGFSDFAKEVNVRLDPARLAAQVISGIGFLGAGVIMRTGFSITGLTTAASLWVVSAIGLAIGAGFYMPAALSTGLVLFSLLVLNKVESRWLAKKKIHIIRIRSLDRPGIIGKVSFIMERNKADIRKVGIEQHEEQESKDQDITISMTVRVQKHKMLVQIIENVRNIDGVEEVTVE